MNGIKIDHNGWHSEEHTVETVEHTAMAWENVSAVLNAELAFEHALHEVAPSAEDYDNEGEAQPVKQGHIARESGVEQNGNEQTQHGTADRAHPTLVGRDAFEEFCWECLVQ